jgi:hypothetical protein
VPRDPLEQLLGGSVAEGFDQTLRIVHVEILKDQMNQAGVWTTLDQLANEAGEAHASAGGEAARTAFPRWVRPPRTCCTSSRRSARRGRAVLPAGK